MVELGYWREHIELVDFWLVTCLGVLLYLTISAFTIV